MISKELLSEVLNVDAKSILQELNGELHYETSFYDDGFERFIQHKINIYELAHKCKEWANKHNYIVWSEIENARVSSLFDLEGNNDIWFKSETEPEAIFKACEWILEQKGQQ